MKFLNLDIYTMLILLAFGNISSLLIFLTYRGLSSNKRVYVQFMAGKLLQALAWALLSTRGQTSDLWSAYLANTILFLGFALECIAFINLKTTSAKVEGTWILLAVAGSLSYYLLADSPSLKVAWASLASSIMYLPTAILIIRVRNSTLLYRVMGFVLGTFSVLLLFRAWYGFTIPENFFLLSSNNIQTLAFLPLFFMLLGGSTGFLLLLKEQDDQLITLSKDKYNILFRSAPYSIAISSLNEDTLLEVNENFERLTGYAKEEIYGKTPDDLRLWVHDGDRQNLGKLIKSQGRIDQYELEYRSKIGEVRTCLLSTEIIEIGHDRLLLSSLHDIESRKRVENGTRQQLADKELQLKEVHHRIKNNINTITSLLNIQADMTKSASAKGSLLDAANRMHGMSLLYDYLYNTSDYTSLPIRDYFLALIEQLKAVFPGREFVRVELEIDEFDLPPKILSPLGLIINELFTNSMKYAFKGRETGRISITMKVTVRQLFVAYEDDGPGIKKLSAGTHFGLILVESLAGQLAAVMTRTQKRGLRYEFSLSV